MNLQRKILEQASTYVKPGGTLIYSTCTINREENIENVRWFVENYPYELESIDDYLCEELRSDTTKKGICSFFRVYMIVMAFSLPD